MATDAISFSPSISHTFSIIFHDLSPWRVEYTRLPTNQMIRLVGCVHPAPPVAASTERKWCFRLIPSSCVVTKEIEDSLDSMEELEIAQMIIIIRLIFNFQSLLHSRYKLEYLLVNILSDFLRILIFLLLWILFFIIPPFCPSCLSTFSSASYPSVVEISCNFRNQRAKWHQMEIFVNIIFEIPFAI